MTETLKTGLLAECANGYAEALVAFDKLVEGLSDAQANFKPTPKKWSINECIEHINISNRLYAAKLEAAIEKARAAGKTGSEPYGRGTLMGRFILNNLRQGAKARKVPAPGKFKPVDSEHDQARLSEEFRRYVNRLKELAEQAEGLPLGKLKFPTPVAPIGRVTAAQAFEMMRHHTQRHLGQAERVKTAEGFPA